MEILTDKVRSTPKDIARAVFEAVKKLGVDLRSVGLFVHGTTVGLNTVVQRVGAKVGLITTEGFTDVLEMGRGDRKELYNWMWKKPKPLVKRSLRAGIKERTNFLGEILTPVLEDDVRGVVERLKERGVESIAVCLLHSYANPYNEKEVERIIHDVWPDVDVSLSHQVAMEFREFERTSTTVLDAYIKGRVVEYLTQLSSDLEKNNFKGQLLIMSPSGVLGVDAIKDKSIATFASGPIGGVSGSIYISKLAGYKNLVTMDSGGTSFDVSLVRDGEAVIRHQTELMGYPVLMPGMDIQPIGAGGGSIARVDSGGLLTVGPESAGADPGPICYGQGGTEPTVTDAALVNGLINPGYFLGGEIGLNMELAKKGIENIGEKLGLTLNETADGILMIARNNMTTATKEILINQGYDPRDFTLMCYGGSGGIFATGIAQDMSISRIVVPPTPGVFSARGMLTMDISHTFARTYARSLGELDISELAEMYLEMKEKGRAMLRNEQIPNNEMSFIRSLDMAYEGQGHYVEVPLPGDILNEDSRVAIIEAFHDLHEIRYGHRMEGIPKTINIRLNAIGKIKEIPVKKNKETREIPEAAFKEKRMVYSGGRLDEWKILDRANLLPGNSMEGPLIVEEPHHTTIVPPNQKVTVDPFRNLVIEIGKEV
jgi:N-methylhydantoinase A